MAKPYHPNSKENGSTEHTLRSATHVPIVGSRHDKGPHQTSPTIWSKYVSDATLASVIDSSRSTVWRYVRQGILPPPIKIGGLTRFDLDHTLACIRAGKIIPAPGDRT